MEKEETRINEIKESIDQKKKELDNLTRLVAEKKSEINSLYEEIADQYSSMEKYFSLIGKKVRVSWREYDKTKSIDGYFDGFIYIDEMFYKNIFPKLAKINKDGSRSKNSHTYYNLPTEDLIGSIEQI